MSSLLLHALIHHHHIPEGLCRGGQCVASSVRITGIKIVLVTFIITRRIPQKETIKSKKKDKGHCMYLMFLPRKSFLSLKSTVFQTSGDPVFLWWWIWMNGYGLDLDINTISDKLNENITKPLAVPFSHHLHLKATQYCSDTSTKAS